MSLLVMRSAPVTSQDAEQYLSLSSPSVVEGDSGTSVLRFVLSRGADGKGDINYTAATTNDGTATAGVDFTAFSSSGTISASQSINLDVSVIGDTDIESNETVVMRVTGAWPA